MCIRDSSCGTQGCSCIFEKVPQLRDCFSLPNSYAYTWYTLFDGSRPCSKALFCRRKLCWLSRPKVITLEREARGSVASNTRIVFVASSGACSCTKPGAYSTPRYQAKKGNVSHVWVEPGMPLSLASLYELYELYELYDCTIWVKIMKAVFVSFFFHTWSIKPSWNEF